MEKVTELYMDELSREVTVGGIKFIVTATKVEEGQWRISVQNEYGIFTNWLDYFSTPQLAIYEGIMSIENEGVNSFVEIDGFEYLFE